MNKAIIGLAALGLGLAVSEAWAQTADTILVNGKILTVDANFSTAEALAVRDGRIAAVGRTAEVEKLAGPNTRTIDLGGRTVIPGLNDSHIHAIRAGLTYSVEVSWIGVPSLGQALARIREAAASSRPDTWIKVGGGWTELQFQEKRLPTPAELAAAAPGHPVFVQHLYDRAFLTPAAMQALNITGDESVPPRGRLERDAGGQPTGVVDADIATLNQLIDKLPTADFAQQVDGTKRYFRELNRLGLTGVNDVTGGGMFPVHYRPVETVWREHQLTLRVAFHFQSQHRGKEFEDYQQYTTFLPQGFGDDLLRFEGLGEGLTWAMYDGSTIGAPFNPSEEARDAYYRIALWAAQQGLTVHQHATTDRAASLILDAFERVNEEVPITGLRWQLTHIENASERTLERMKALNMGWSVQDRLLYAGAHFVKVAGAEAGRRAPPIKTGLKLGLMVAAGTDSDQVAPYNPFVSLRWLLDGKAIDGTPVRGPEESPSREEALEMYTRNAAWFVHAEDRRGSLEPGKLADLAVLSKDYMTVPVEEVGEIQSLLTMLGGKVVYAAGPYAQLEARM